ncbi:hypothetical protein GCM10018966_010880 [Streptomyces yanii]
MWGLPQRAAPTCMLVLAVAAGKSGANPELSRNGVFGALLRILKVRGPADSASGSTDPDAQTSGPRGWAGGRRTQGCPPSPGMPPRGCPAPPPAPSRARESTT